MSTEGHKKTGSLVINLPVGEEFLISPDIKIKVIRASNGWAKLSFIAPRSVKIVTKRTRPEEAEEFLIALGEATPRGAI